VDSFCKKSPKFLVLSKSGICALLYDYLKTHLILVRGAVVLVIQSTASLDKIFEIFKDYDRIKNNNCSIIYC